MDFNDTPAEAEFRAKARAFLDKHRRPLAAGESNNMLSERDDPDTIKRAKEWQALKLDNGWAVLTWPKEFGGRDATPIQSVIWNQEEARYQVPPNIFAIGLGMLGPTIMAHGTAEQKGKYIPRMARGDDIWCQLFSEPAAGSDLAGLRTSAVKKGDDWIVNGQKIWTTGAHFSKWGMIVTRTDPTVAKHAGLTYFIVDMESPGIEIRQIKQINGGSGFNEVFFSDVKVPESNRLGRVGDGWRVALTTLMNERASIGGGGGGMRTDDLIRMARESEWSGRPALEDSSVRQRIADFYIRSSGLKYTGYRTLTALSKGTTPGPESSIGKLVGAPLGQEVAAFAIELQGLAGGALGAPQEAYLGSPGLRIAGGTDEIMRNILAERVLRLPPEPRLDKDTAFRDVPTGPPAK
ncbi:MAG TPA: acyl-CoA dehydrogenase family protein [Myxococcota bacterium]|nr:acyl-CoA dehydrogenase family protein [Myxococcota bacterium]